MSDLAEYSRFFPKKVLVLANCGSVSGFISTTLLHRFFLRRGSVDMRSVFLTRDGFDSYLSEIRMKPGLIAGYDLFVLDFPLRKSYLCGSDHALSAICTLAKYCQKVSWLDSRWIDFSVLDRNFNYYSCMDNELCSASIIFNRMFGNRIATHDLEMVRPEYLVGIAETTDIGGESASGIAKDAEMVRDVICLAMQSDCLGLLSELCREIAVHCEWRVDLYRMVNFLRDMEKRFAEVDS